MGEYEDQLQPQDSLEDRGLDDVLDEGISPPEQPRGVTAKGITAEEQREGETFAERDRQHEPDVFDELEAEAETDTPDDPASSEVGTKRAGRLLAPDEGAHEDTDAELVASDEGISGAGASAEEAAVHVIEPQDSLDLDADELEQRDQ